MPHPLTKFHRKPGLMVKRTADPLWDFGRMTTRELREVRTWREWQDTIVSDHIYSTLGIPGRLLEAYS
jgi:hypothetical protein